MVYIVDMSPSSTYGTFGMNAVNVSTVVELFIFLRPALKTQQIYLYVQFSV